MARMATRSGARLVPGVVLVACLLAVVGVRRYFRHDPDAAGFVSGAAASRSERVVKVPCKAVDKNMMDRIKSVQKTGKLTDAMRLVAAATVRRAQDGLEKSRPFSDELQGMIKGLVKKLKGSGLEAELPMLRAPDKVKNVGILLLTSNRGLCGPYNTFIMKKAKRRIEDLNAQGIVPKILVVGKKSLSGMKNRLADFVKYNYTGTFFPMPNTITAKAANDIGDALRALFLSGEVDKVEIIYGKFYNLLKNEPTVRSILPLTPTGIEDPEDETFTMTTEDGKMTVKKEKVKAAKAKDIENDVIFDQSPTTILNSMLPLYLNSNLLSLLYDAQASELSSRMNAMKAATDNAGELVKKLTVIYNKKRQAAITQEICELSAGALALEAKGNVAGGDLGIFDTEDTVVEDFMKEVEDGSLPESPPEPEGPEDRPVFEAAAA